MNTKNLEQIAKQIVAPGKGILAADESFPTIEKRFKAIGIESTEENRRAYREMLFTTAGIEEFISGVILFDETLRQDILKNKNIIPGIKVDQGLESFNGSEKEKITKGLDGLPERLAEYAKLGAKFSKWRAAIYISGQDIPTQECILQNAKLLAEYALASQEAGLVPIVEPEVLLDGNHTIEQCKEVVEKVTKVVFEKLKEKNVFLPGLILKSSMVLSGKENPVQADLQKLAQETVDALKKTVPAEVAGIVFISGGQEDVLATERLNEINKLKEVVGAPWPLSFSYGRALQDKTLKTWAGKPENKELAQKEFYRKCKANGLACQGKL